MGDGLCVVGKDFIHGPALAVIVEKEKESKQGKYKAFYTRRKCETSRVSE